MLKTCIYCGETIEAIRSTRKFCDDLCKQRYHALNRKIKDDGDSAEEMLRRLALKAKNYPDKSSEVIKQVRRIESLAQKLSARLIA